MSEPIALVAFDDLPDGRGRRICAAGLDIALFRIGDAVHAIDDSCPHAGASLSNGCVQGTSVACRAHGLRFELRRGAARNPASLQAATYAVRVVDGIVMLDLGDAR